MARGTKISLNLKHLRAIPAFFGHPGIASCGTPPQIASGSRGHQLRTFARHGCAKPGDRAAEPFVELEHRLPTQDATGGGDVGAPDFRVIRRQWAMDNGGTGASE